jgi:transmembrane sensor
MNSRVKNSTNSKRHFLSGGTFRWSRSMEDVWRVVEHRIDRNPLNRLQKLIRLNVFKYAAAAVVLLLLGGALAVQLYTKTIDTEWGQQLTVILPDASTVKLNAQSQLKYKPLAWVFNRDVKLNGEAFFEVTPGKRFSVTSSLGQTRVLGTSFNIFARDNIYKVICVTGKVEVKAGKDQRVIISPNNVASFGSDGTLQVAPATDALVNLGWLHNRFIFTATPINEVFKEIERQYGVRLTVKAPVFQLYSGNFIKTERIEEVLELVCPPLGLTFVKHSQKEYYIVKPN